MESKEGAGNSDFQVARILNVIILSIFCNSVTVPRNTLTVSVILEIIKTVSNMVLEGMNSATEAGMKVASSLESFPG